MAGHGIAFERSKRNLEAFEKASILWSEIASKNNLNGSSIVVLCGAKSNGKSSLARYLVNNYLRCSQKESHEEKSSDNEFGMMDDDEDDASRSSDPEDKSRYSYYIDLDPGQCEMNSPGMIATHIIKSTEPPLVSPTYLNTAQHEPLVMASVGGLSMSVNPQMYIENCRYMINTVKQHREEQPIKRPIIINTMGYIRNVGLTLLTDIIKLSRPTNLIVLNVESDAMRTIYADLSSKAVDNIRASFYYETHQESQSKQNYQYDLYNLPFTFSDSTSVSTKNRTALQLAYISTIPEALYKPIMQLGTKWISLKRVSVFCVSSYPLKEGIVLELLHHSWVHLVKLKRASAIVDQQPKQSQEGQQECDHDTSNTVIHSDGSRVQQNRVIQRILDNVNENNLYGCGIVAEIDYEKRMMSIITPLSQETLDNEVDCIIKPLSIQVPPEMLRNDISSFLEK